MGTVSWQTLAAVFFLLPLALPSCMCYSPVNAGSRIRRGVFKRARPPGGDDSGGRPTTGLLVGAAGGDVDTVAEVTATARPNQGRPHLLDFGRLLQMVVSPSDGNASDRQRRDVVDGNKSQLPAKSGRIDASMAELVALQTFDGDVAWIEATFINDSAGAVNRRHRHRTRPYSFEERLALIVPVVAFALPFLAWLFCMMVCIARASAKASY